MEITLLIVEKSWNVYLNFCGNPDIKFSEESKQIVPCQTAHLKQANLGIFCTCFSCLKNLALALTVKCFFASGHFCHILTTFANSLDPD